MLQKEQWNGFEGRLWKEEINVRDFVQNNYKPYDGDESFLEGPTEATNKLWGRLQELQKEERAKGGVLDMETEVVAGLTAYHKNRIFATKTPGSAPVRAAGSSAFSTHPFCTRMSTCTKQCPEVWQALLLKFETIYLKIVSDVVLSL